VEGVEPTHSNSAKNNRAKNKSKKMIEGKNHPIDEVHLGLRPITNNG